MNLLNIDEWTWDADLLDATAPDLAKRLPAVVDGNSTAGTVADYFVQKFGFSAGTPITVFTGDNPSSLVGMGASRPGRLVISLGTSDTFFAAMPSVQADPNGCGHVFGNPTGGSMSLQCFVNGSLAREGVKDHFGYDWAQFTEALESTPRVTTAMSCCRSTAPRSAPAWTPPRPSCGAMPPSSAGSSQPPPFAPAWKVNLST